MLELPADKSPWPLPSYANQVARIPVADAWYSGDPGRLTSVHSGSGYTAQSTDPTAIGNGDGVVRRVVRAVFNRNPFWAPRASTEADNRRHLSTALDIAIISSEILYSDPPTLTVEGPVYEEDATETNSDGDPVYLKGDPKPVTVQAQKRLDYITAKMGLFSTLLAASEISAALGWKGLRVSYDKSQIDYPVLSRVDADATLPVYSWGQLVGVMFWQTLSSDNGTFWRHIELHQKGMVTHGLYKGGPSDLGQRQPLGAHAATAQLDTDPNGNITVPGGVLTGFSVPNILPDPLDRLNNAGRSDYTPAVLDLFDAIDRLYTQMMETVEDAKSRLIISESMLEDRGRGNGVAFNMGQHMFQRVKMPPAEEETSRMPIEQIQFKMNLAEYLLGIEALTSRAIKAAGYNAQTMGDDTDGSAMTATEYTGKSRRSMSTRDKKIRYEQPMLEDALTSLVAVDVAAFQPRGDDNLLIQAFPVRVTFPEAIQPTQRELGETAKVLKDAGAASPFELVKTVHPEWNDTMVNKEVQRIKNAYEVADPTTIGLGGIGFGGDA